MSNTAGVCASTEENDLIANLVFPIESKDSLDKLEDMLRNKSIKEKLVYYNSRKYLVWINIFTYHLIFQINKLSCFFGKSGNGDHRRICYGLVDKVFARTLLDLFTWTGVSKSNSKFALQKYDNVNDLFFKIVLATDKNFTTNESGEFFKNSVLRHSKQRLKVKPNSRLSMPRVRLAKNAL